jgi:hypothetical protein
MSSILYYSNYCDPSKKLIFELSRSKVKDEIHFVCIDHRVKGPKDTTHIILDNGQKLLLPDTVIKVPALLLLFRGHQVLFGDEIYKHLKQRMNKFTQEATQNNQEPLAFSFSEMGSNLSDNYSYLDQTADDLSAKGKGGLRILHNYVTLDSKCPIETPPESYVPDKIGNVDLGKIQMKRNEDIEKYNVNKLKKIKN